MFHSLSYYGPSTLSLKTYPTTFSSPCLYSSSFLSLHKSSSIPIPSTKINNPYVIQDIIRSSITPDKPKPMQLC